MPTIIIIAGGTASGKTSIATDFASRHDCLIIHHDRYYKDILFPPDANFDEPEALDNDLLATHLATLKKGLAAELPIYDFPTHRRLKETESSSKADQKLQVGRLSNAVKLESEKLRLATEAEKRSQTQKIKRDSKQGDK